MPNNIIICLHLMRQHIKVCWRSGYVLLSIGFLFIAIILLPFGVGADLILLQRLAPGLLWIALLLTLLVSLDSLFTTDKEDGSLDQIFLLPLAPELALAAKLLGHCVALLLPLLLAMPVAGLLLNLDFTHFFYLWTAMAASAPALTFLGGLGAALSLASQRGALLTTLLLMPFYIPIMIMGVFAYGGALAPLLILAALSLAALLLVPFAICALLRQS